MTGATIGRGPREGMEPWTWTWAPSNKSPLDSKHLRVACHLVDFWLRPDISQQYGTCCYVCDPCSQVCRIEFRPTCCNVQRKLSDPKHKFALFKLHKLGKLLDIYIYVHDIIYWSIDHFFSPQLTRNSIICFSSKKDASKLNPEMPAPKVGADFVDEQIEPWVLVAMSSVGGSQSSNQVPPWSRDLCPGCKVATERIMVRICCIYGAVYMKK